MEATPAELGLRDVRGPSALSGGWRHFLRLSWRLARTDFSLRYHGSALGYLWSLISPLLYFGVLYLAFTRVLRFGGQVEHYAAMLLFNLMLFQFFAEATTRAVTSIVAQESLVRKTEFPRLAVPFSLVLSSLVSLGFNLIVVLGYAIASGVPVRATWLLLPVIVLALLVFTTGCSVLLSSLYVRFRDVDQIWTVLTRALVYITPVILPLELYPHSWRWVLGIDPLTPILVEARRWIIDPSAPSFDDLLGRGAILLPAAVLLATCLVAIWHFNREAPMAAEDL
jgi:ABC-2 type transport system permease protein